MYCSFKLYAYVHYTVGYRRMYLVKDGLSYLFHSFRNKYFNKNSLGNMLYFKIIVKVFGKCMVFR